MSWAATATVLEMMENLPWHIVSMAQLYAIVSGGGSGKGEPITVKKPMNCGGGRSDGACCAAMLQTRGAMASRACASISDVSEETCRIALMCLSEAG